MITARFSCGSVVLSVNPLHNVFRVGFAPKWQQQYRDTKQPQSGLCIKPKTE